MPSTSLRFVTAVAFAALTVPFVCSAIQINMVSVRNGHGLAIAGGIGAGFAALPLGIIAAPLTAVGATFLGAFSLGMERLVGRRNIVIWLFHGTVVGCLSLWALHGFAPSSLVTVGVIGSWLAAALVMSLVLPTEVA